MTSHTRPSPIRLLLLATLLLFLGRAWQAWYFDLPLEDVLWDEKLMTPFLDKLAGMSWEDYASTETADNLITGIANSLGWFWALCALASVGIWWKPRWWRWLMLPGAASLFILSLFYWKEGFKNVGQLWEYSLQFCTPILLWVAVDKGIQNNFFRKLALLATAVTFACHGLYAAGYYPQPGEWRQWCMVVFFMNDHTAVVFLKIMGILDFLAAAILLIPIFITSPHPLIPSPPHPHIPSSPHTPTSSNPPTSPHIPTSPHPPTSPHIPTSPHPHIPSSPHPHILTSIQNSALCYCVIWGLMTALARLVAPLEYAEGISVGEYLHQNLFEFLVRLPHAVIPFILLQTIPLSLSAKTKLAP